MNKTYSLPFLENRNYLHSTTLFAFLQNKTAACKNICFKFIHPVYSDNFLLNSNTENANSVFQYEENGKLKTIAIHERPQSTLICREKFDEQAIIDKAYFKNCTVSANITEENFFSHTVALIKELHLRELKKNIPGRWIFTRADLVCLPQNGSVTINLSKTLPVLSCCTIEQYGKEIGKIYFSWVEKI